MTRRASTRTGRGASEPRRVRDTRSGWSGGAGACGLAALLALAGLPSAAVEPPQVRCLADALGQWSCASDPNGVAVVDGLGAVVCAPGRCVKTDDGWRCSSRSGGGAELTPAGAVCAGECRKPRAAECDKI